MQLLHKCQYASFAYCNMVLVITMYERIKALREDNDLTQKQISKELNISRSYVSRIEKRALTKILREFIRNNKK